MFLIFFVSVVLSVFAEDFVNDLLLSEEINNPGDIIIVPARVILTPEVQFDMAGRVFAQAEVLKANKRFEEAVEKFKLAVKMYEEFKTVHPEWEKDFVNFRINYSIEQINAIETCLTKNKKGMGSNVHMINLKAENLLRRIKNDPDDVETRVMLALLQFQNGNIEDTIYLLEGIFEDEPDNISARIMLAGIYVMINMLDKAEAELYRVLMKDHDNLAGILNLLQLHLLKSPPDLEKLSFYYNLSLNLGAKRNFEIEELLGFKNVEASPE